MHVQQRSYATGAFFVTRPLFQALKFGGLAALLIAQTAAAQELPRPPLNNQASYRYENEAARQRFEGVSGLLNLAPNRLIDPLGRILGCNGDPLPDYAGFSVALYAPNPADPTGSELGPLVPLTPTESPDVENNGVFGGLPPNTTNLNPFNLTNGVAGELRGAYNFLLDPSKGQLASGSTYILVVKGPANSIFSQRRVKLQILNSTGGQQNNIVRYVATSLDGQPISAQGDMTVEDTVAFVANAELIGLDLLAFRFTTRMCQPEQVQIVKTADRAAAEPGDAVVYRLSVRSRSDSDLEAIAVSDTLPLGFEFLPQSVRGEIAGKVVPVTTEQTGSTVTFRSSAPLPTNQVLNIAYAARLSPDAVRGSGVNTASVQARRSDNRFTTADGPANHRLQIRSGIISDCGTILGRVFEDKNFDGEQQPGEPGIPNAVVFLDDGNRITSDRHGLFSVANVLSGHRSGVLDLSSIPGYRFAPNQRFKERNSQSRLVHLAPGGSVRMNFAVTPIAESASPTASPDKSPAASPPESPTASPAPDQPAPQSSPAQPSQEAP
jgi:uncharacterized repeat protein (TIGR01451 family)